MRQLYATTEKLVIGLARFVLDQPEVSTLLFLVIVCFHIYIQMKKYVGKKHTKTENTFPQLDKLKEVKTEAKPTNQGNLLLALCKVGIAFLLLYVILQVFR